MLAAVLLILGPFAGALVAVRYAPAATVTIAGQTVSVKPVLGRNTTELAGGAIVRPEHAHVLGEDIGVDIGVDWNDVIPQNKQTRQYLTQLWDDPQPAMAAIKSTATRHIVTWAAIGFGIVLFFEIGDTFVVRWRRRRLAAYPDEVASAIHGHMWPERAVVVGSAVALLVALEATAVGVVAHRDHETVVGSPVFAGTGLEGTEVDGLVREVVPFLSMIEPHSAFYDTVSDNLDKALGDDPDLRAKPDDVLFVEAEDFEDVNGMARIVGHAAQLTKADFITYTGDLTFAGKPLESYIIDTVNYYSGGVPVEFAPGLHDTPAITQAATSRGWTVADGHTHTVDKVSLLTLADPRVSTVGDFGTSNVYRDPDVTGADFLEAAEKEACDTRPDLILLHDHVLGRPLAETGCAKVAVIDGRSYTLVGAQQVQARDGSMAVEYTVGSTGGHTTTQPNPGNIQAPATFELFDLDPTTGSLAVTVVTVKPDRSVTLSDPIPVTSFTPARH